MAGRDDIEAVEVTEVAGGFGIARRSRFWDVIAPDGEFSSASRA